MEFREFLYRNQKKYLLNFAFKSFLIFLNFILSVILFLYGINALFIIGRNLRIAIFWILIGMTILFFLFLFLKVFIKKVSVLKISGILERRNQNIRDDLTNAYELFQKIGEIEKTGMSEELVKLHLEKTNAEIEGLKEIGIFEDVNIRYFIIPFLFLVLNFFVSFSRILNPFSTYFLDNFIEVEIDKNRIIKGENVEVEVKTKKNLNLGIMYKTDNTFTRDKMEKVEGKFRYIFKNVLKDLFFRFYYRDNYSKVYKIGVFEEPVVSITETEYFYPEYTGRKNQIFFNKPDISVITGTSVLIRGESNVILKSGFIKTDYGEKNPIEIKGKKFKVEIVVSKSGYYWIEVVSKDGFKNASPVKYLLEVKKDEFPNIEIISPKMDLKIKKGEKIPVVYKTEDDFGITEVDIHFKIKNKEKVFILKKTNKVKESFIESYNIDTNLFNEGDIVYYFLSCKDNDTFSGPKISKTRVYELEIVSFREMHLEVQNIQKEIKNQIFELLSREMGFKDKFDEYITEKDTENLKNLATLKEDYERYLNEISEKTSKLIEEMNKDPYVNLSVFNEYRGLKENLNFLEENFYKKQISDLKGKRFKNVNLKQEKLLNELERLSLLSEEIMKRANMNDVISDTRELEERAESLKNFLKNKEWNPEIRKKLNKIFKEINELMNSIANTLKNMPQNLPEDFVNKESVKKIDFNNMNESLSKMAKALKENNLEEALKEAEKLLKRIQDILSTLEDARSEVPSPFSLSYMDELKEKENRLNDLVNKETLLRKKTDYYERLREKRFFTENKDIKENLKNKFKDIFNRYKNLWYVRKELRRAKEELDKDDVFKFKGIVKKIMETSKNRGLIKDLEKIFEYIDKKNEEYFGFNDEEKENILKLKEEQLKIKEETIVLRREILKQTRKTFLLPKEMILNLDKAVESMEKAENNLGVGRTKNALEKEDEAIYYLEKSGDYMKNSIDKLKSLSGKQNKSVSGFIQKRIGSSSGNFGVREGYVELPKPEDFKQDAKLLEAIRENLKKNYPDKYKEIIRDYFQKLQE